MTDLLGAPTDLLVAPTSAAAEWSVLGHMLADPALIGEVIGVPLEQSDFSQPDTRLLYATTVARYYANQPVDALIVGEVARDELAGYWSADPSSVAQLLVHRARDSVVTGTVLEHAAIVKRLSTGRKLQDACYHALRAISEGQLSPEEIGDALGTETAQVTAGTIKRSELLDWTTVGNQYLVALERVRQARMQGLEIGVYTGFPFIDDWTTGIGGGELCFLAGEPGVGKTALAWAAAMGFASRQMQVPPERRVSTLLLSMEMNLYSSTARMVAMLTAIDGTALREGRVDAQQFQRITTEWKNRENVPMYFNFASNFRLSQMRALIAEAIRRHNVGFVVIDHFRMLDTDRRYDNGNQEDEARVRFLKENIAKDLNVAVMCLAHTVKVGRGQGGESPKPRLSDLRGSGMIAAFADFIAMAWNPGAWLSDDARDEMDIPPDEGDMELLWVKNRFGSPATAPYHFMANKMRVTTR